MLPVFLIGGGGEHPEPEATYGRFLQATTRPAGTRLVLVVAAETPDEAQETLAATRAIFTTLGADPVCVTDIRLGPGGALTADQLAALAPTGVFICGGLTPLYQEVLCRDPAWLDVLRADEIAYGGTSAGAAVAATTAIVGGWRAQRGDRARAILFQGASEDRDLLDVRPGLGLVPFAVDVHASQWGTLSRALHAVDGDRVAEVWAIDEATLLQVDAAGLQVHGVGHAYHLQRDPAGGVHISIYVSGARLAAPG